MNHDLFYPEDLAPGYRLGLDNLETTHNTVLAAYGADPEHAQTIRQLPWAAQTLLETARRYVAQAQTPIYDFDLAFNYWNWLYQFALYGQNHALAWDLFETVMYPRLEDVALNQFCLKQGLAFIENSQELIEKWQPIIPGLLNQLKISGVRVICNHATWMSQGILIILFYHAVQKYSQDHPQQRKQVEALGLYDAMEFGTKVNTLLGPWITTLGHKLNPHISNLSAMAGIQILSNVVKVFPDTPSGRFEACYRRWQAGVRKALKMLRTLETTPGNLIFETPSGRQDQQEAEFLVPGRMAKAAVRLARSRPNQLILIGMDERGVFDRGVQSGGFSGGIMQAGRVGLSIRSLIGPRDPEQGAHWPFQSWQHMEPAVADLIEDAQGNKIGRAVQYGSN